MIPKIIHFCWLSGEPYPARIRKCMETWRKAMPDYERKLWSLDNFDITSAPQFVRDAVAARKWAFAADYIRMYALHTEGGFYLDSDVVTLKRFDDFLNYKEPSINKTAVKKALLAGEEIVGARIETRQNLQVR